MRGFLYVSPFEYMPRTSDARANLIAAAADLFQRQGYHGTGLTQLLAESDAPKGSFYHHFPEGKEQLAEAAVLKAGGEVAGLVDAAFVRAESFEAGVRATAKAIAKWFKASDYAAGCPITSVLLETAPQSERLRLACKSVFEQWTQIVAAHARRFGHSAGAERLAEALVLALEGAWILARSTRTTRPFDIAAEMTIALARA